MSTSEIWTLTTLPTIFNVSNLNVKRYALVQLRKILNKNIELVKKMSNLKVHLNKSVLNLLMDTQNLSTDQMPGQLIRNLIVRAISPVLLSL